MPQPETRTFTVEVPNEMDGDPFEVAERALRQAGAVAAVLESMLPAARTMALNAELERQLFATGECDAPSFEGTALARNFDRTVREVAEAKRSLGLLATAAGYNPRSPVKA